MLPTVTRALTLFALFASSVLAGDSTAQWMSLPNDISGELIRYADHPWALNPLSLTCRGAFRARVRQVASLFAPLGFPTPREPTFEEALIILHQARLLNILHLRWPKGEAPFGRDELGDLMSHEALWKPTEDKLRNPLEFKRLFLFASLMLTPSSLLSDELMDYLLDFIECYLLQSHFKVDSHSACVCSLADNVRGEHVRVVLEALVRALRSIGPIPGARQQVLKYWWSRMNGQEDLSAKQLVESYGLTLDAQQSLEEAESVIAEKKREAWGSILSFGCLAFVGVIFTAAIVIPDPQSTS